MRVLNKFFFMGMGTGVILTVALIVLAGFILVRTGADMEGLEQRLSPPPFPTRTEVSDLNWVTS